jgi:hypothetical protein
LPLEKFSQGGLKPKKFQTSGKTQEAPKQIDRRTEGVGVKRRMAMEMEQLG